MADLNDHTSRAHAVLSASSSERWLACPGSVRVSEKYPKQDTPFTREGTLAHEVAESIARGIDPATIEVGYDRRGNENGITDEMVRHGCEYRDYIQGLCTPDTVMMLEQRVDFSDVVPDGFGTADCILLHGTTIDVVDYKYGQGVSVSAVGNPQMQLYALGALNEYGFVYDIETVRMHIFQPRKDNISVWETSVEHLYEFAEFATAMAAQAISDTPGFEAGSHCRFCPHAGHCSVLAAHSFRACTDAPDFCKDPATLSPEQVAYVLKEAPVITAWLDAVKDAALKGLQNGEEIPGYKLVEGKLGNRKWTDELQVMQALESAGYQKEDFAPPVLLGPSGIDKLLGKKKAAELLSDLISRDPGKPTVVPVSDKRPAYEKVNPSDFTDI